MNMNKPLEMRVRWYYVTILMAVSLVYARLIWRDPILGLDDYTLIENLKHWIRWIDLQPVRDLSLFIDLQLKNISGWGTFHLTNVIIWLYSIYLMAQISHRLIDRKYYYWLYGLLLIYSIHPVFVGSVGWIAARKHLLSYLFTLLAMNKVMKSGSDVLKNKNILVISIYYLLAQFSNPMSLLWPLWLLYYLKTEVHIQSVIKRSVTLYGSLLIVFISNVYYYSYVYQGHSKFVYTGMENGVIALLSLGRYLYNFFFPYKLAVSYQLYSVENILSIILLLVFALVLIKLLGRKIFYLWGLYYLLMLAPVTLNNTGYFMSNTYFLNSSFAIFILILLVLMKIPRSKYLLLPFLLISVAIFASSYNEVGYWLNTNTVYEHSFENEPNYRNTRMYLESSLENADFNYHLTYQAVENLIEITGGRDPILPKMFSRYFLRFFEMNELTDVQKIKFLKKVDFPNPFSMQFLAILYARINECNDAKLVVEKLRRFPNVERMVNLERDGALLTALSKSNCL